MSTSAGYILCQVKVTIGDNEPQIYDYAEGDITYEGGKYVVRIENIKAKEYGTEVKAEFLKNGEAIEDGAVIYYSINAYLYAQHNVSAESTKNLVRALYNYGQAVYAYEN